MTLEEMEAIVMSFPGAEKGMSYGSPAYKLNGKKQRAEGLFVRPV